MSLTSLFVWLHDTSFSIWLRDSTWTEPIVETIHVLSLTLFFGFAVLLDSRLLGITMKRRRISEVLAQLNPWLIAGFIVMTVSGILLFMGDPVSFYQTTFFKVKIILIVLAGLNVLVFNATIGSRMESWDLASPTPGKAKAAAILSLCFWIAIIAAGRAIAYVLPPP
ncbi:MAG: DUF6644 family protein [Candidatus Acidiferrales bacterium]|jgi:uncharacterized membrane protein